MVSLAVILPGVVFLIIAPGLKPGIDFTGGSSITLDFAEDVAQEDLRRTLADLEQPDATVQKLGDDTYFVRTKELSNEEKSRLVKGLEVSLSPVDYTIGSSVTVEFVDSLEQEDLQLVLADLGHPEAMIQELEGNAYILRTEQLSDRQKDELIKALESSRSAGGDQDLSIAFVCRVPFDFVCPISSDLVSPVVARETVVNALWAVLAAAVGIFFYIWWAFRNVPSPFRYGAAAIVALLHDVIIVIGIFAILGEVLDTEVNTMFLIALLTVIGYSVNDTIVVFDRLRENVLLYPNRAFADVVNLSISETIGRSLNTSLTLLFTLLALILFGGSTIRTFMLVLLIGVVAGTYSSIAIASQVLVAWEYGDLGRLFRRIRSPLASGAR